MFYFVKQSKQKIVFCKLTIENKVLPIYSAISFQRIMIGGRTNPWLVLVNAGGLEKPYVVKLFNQNENEKRGSIVNEIIGNVLANEFGLCTPKPALIDIDTLFESTINDPNAFHTYEHADERLKFGCEFLFPTNQFTAGAFTKRQIQKAIEMDSLFAFDNLIQNADRGQGKPNLLLKDQSAFLIDHELAFNIDGSTINDILTKNWTTRKYQHHIFYNFLKNKTSKVAKTSYFNEFEEYLRLLNVNSLRAYLNQLNDCGYSTARHEYILHYLEDVRRISSNFVELLRVLIA